MRRYLPGMAESASRKRAAAGASSVTVRVAAASSSRVKFGCVTVSGAKPDPDTVRENVERSRAALERVAHVLTKPGIRIRPKKDVPLYSASEDEPGIFIRKLNGRLERGRFVNGSFKVVD